MKIAAVAILYHPTLDFLENLKTYSSEMDKIYVFDNTEKGCEIKEQILQISKVEYFHDGENNAIAQRLNTAAKKAISAGYDWLLMMDQDSKFEDNSLEIYFHCLQKYPQNQSVGLFGINHSRIYQASLLIAEIKQADLLITSGSVLNLHLFPKIGDFDENLFIDFVDTDYSIRCKKMGYQLVLFNNIFIKHELGTIVRRASIKTLYLVKKSKSVYSAIRYYYLCKNNLYLQQKHKDYDASVMKSVDKTTEIHLRIGIFYGRNFLKILSNIINAHQDFRAGKMGK